MEHDTISPPNKKWSKKDIMELFQQGKTVEEIKAITGLPGRVIGGYKGFINSPMYQGPPFPQEGLQQTQPPPQDGPSPLPSGEATQSRQNGGPGAERDTQLGIPRIDLEAGPGEAQALSSLLGKPYLIAVKNVYVSPDALKCYQFLVARGFKGSVGDFFEMCVLKLFKEFYGLLPGMIRPEAVAE